MIVAVKATSTSKKAWKLMPSSPGGKGWRVRAGSPD